MRECMAAPYSRSAEGVIPSRAEPSTVP
jgi:hypothetical protein